MSSVVLDASAVLAVLFEEPGAEMAGAVMRAGNAVIGAVNYAEVVARLSAAGMPQATIAEMIESLRMTVVDFGAGLAFASGLLYAATKRHGLSLGDRSCLALAKQLGVPALTADRAWAAIKIGVRIKLIR